jgi:hypothetical protein
LIEARICRIYTDENIRTEILPHVSTTRNLQKETTDRVAIVYERPPSRSLRDLEDESAFLDSYRDARIDTLAEKWNRYAFFLGVVHVIPRYERGRLVFVTVTPDSADMIFDPETDEPAILIYNCRAHGATFVAVDSERWVWYDRNLEILYQEEHKVGAVPWVQFRIQEPPEFDYWDRGAGQDLYEETLDAGRVNAHANWVRLNWSKKLTTFHSGENVKTPENQNLGANQPVRTTGDGVSELAVHETIVPIDGFRDELIEKESSVLRAYGLQIKDETPEALIKIRNRQIKHFEQAETELAVRVGAVLRSAGKIRATEDEIRASFRCRFARMSNADHPKDRAETAKAELELGLIDPYSNFQDENPGVTYEEARDYVLANVESRAEFYRAWIENNMPLDPANDLRTAAQINGAIGGKSKFGNENEPGDGPDPDPDPDIDSGTEAGT